jgi:hypothetical protein
VEGSHPQWRDLILCHEDLEGAERAEADGHLAACPECRALLERVRTVERTERPRGQLPPLDAAATLAPPLRDEADQSVRLLRQRLGLAEMASARAGDLHRIVRLRRLTERGVPLRRLAMPLALAAGLALLALVARFGREAEAVHGLRVLPYAGDRGSADSTGTSPRVSWRTGDAFVLAFDLTHPAYPVVFHIGPAGEVSLLHPADPTAEVPRLPAGRGLELPLAEAEETWTLEGSPGTETFLIAAANRADPPVEGVLSRAQVLAGELLPRRDLLSRLVDLLGSELGPVQSVEIEHLP